MSDDRFMWPAQIARHDDDMINAETNRVAYHAAQDLPGHRPPYAATASTLFVSRSLHQNLMYQYHRKPKFKLIGGAPHQ